MTVAGQDVPRRGLRPRHEGRPDGARARRRELLRRRSFTAHTHNYDPTYFGAVAAGLLTPREAFRRGRRALLAMHISKTHLLPLWLAFLVADDAITVGEARQKQAEEDARALDLQIAQEIAALVEPRRRVHPLLLRASAIVAAVTAVAAIGWHGGDRRGDGARFEFATPTAPVAPAPVRPAETAAWQRFTTVVKNDAGVPESVTGPDPLSVLFAFCDSTPVDLRAEPVGVVSARPASPGVRWGLFRLRDSADRTARAIVIRRDPATLRWAVGNREQFVVVDDPATP
jgi:hypothetical protein